MSISCEPDLVHVRGDEECTRHVVVVALVLAYNIYEIEFYIFTIVIVGVLSCDGSTAYLVA